MAMQLNYWITILLVCHGILLCIIPSREIFNSPTNDLVYLDLANASFVPFPPTHEKASPLTIAPYLHIATGRVGMRDGSIIGSRVFMLR